MVHNVMQRLSVCGILAVSLALAGCAASGPTAPTATQDARSQQALRQAGEWLAKGQQAYQEGRTRDAIEALQEAVRLNPADAVSANNLALLLKQEDRFTDAAGILREALEVRPDVAELHYNLAVIAELYLLDLPLALRHYQQYLTLTRSPESRVAGWVADLERRLQ